MRELDPQRQQRQPWQLPRHGFLKTGQEFDRDTVGKASGSRPRRTGGWERLLASRPAFRPVFLVNGRALRLLSAPRGESSGWLDFQRRGHDADGGAADLHGTASSSQRVSASSRFTAIAQRLAALLEDSRKFQNEVSERLAEQVLHALYELLRGFQAAHDALKRGSCCAGHSPSTPTRSTARFSP